MSRAVSERDKQRPILTTANVLWGVPLFVAGCLLLLILLLRSCFDVPIQTSVDLEHKGVPVLRNIKFKHPEQSYAYGFAFRPTFVKGDYWPMFDEAERKKAWAELSPKVDITVMDSSGVIRMREISRISHEDGWTITNGSSQDLPASVYKFITFRPVKGERYQIRVYVVQGCPGAGKLSPRFFVEMPTASL